MLLRPRENSRTSHHQTPHARPTAFVAARRQVRHHYSTQTTRSRRCSPWSSRARRWRTAWSPFALAGLARASQPARSWRWTPWLLLRYRLRLLLLLSRRRNPTVVLKRVPRHRRRGRYLSIPVKSEGGGGGSSGPQTGRPVYRLLKTYINYP